MSKKEYKYSLKIRLSYGIGGFIDNLIGTSFLVRVIDFYENEIFLAIALVGFVMAIYGFWNAINDPILGWMSDKITRYIKKWGRRYPWFLIGIFPSIWLYWLIFLVPFRDETGMFLWLFITIISYEGFRTLWQTNYFALFPDKFRSHEERLNVSVWNTILGAFGIALGFVLPPLIIKYGHPETFVIAILIVAVIATIMTFIVIPSVREDEELKQREYKLATAPESKTSFLEVSKVALKDRNFIGYNIAAFGFQVMNTFMLGSLPYWTKYIIGSSSSLIEVIITVFFLVSVLVGGVPLWIYVGRKVGNQKAYIYGAIATTLLFIPLIFSSDVLSSAVFIALIGIGIGCQWVLGFPCFSDVIDNIVVKTGKRNEGLLNGIRVFIARIPLILEGVLFAAVHIATGYIAGAPPGQASQPPLAQFGIRFLMAIVPMIFYFLGFLAMVFVYNLNMKRVAENKELLKQKNL